ncbi:hypothetical protein [Flexibacterium corallicola]|uniref:hypothetical protein n=1 Tax=Flexibacterium corallicola TaxID=3037259 RepID=UPI00286FA1A3|nr:hypothetical protein [Pseudovibrio sp. M1P-2-3]
MLVEIGRQLAEYFGPLSKSRGLRNVYLIEHPLRDNDLEALWQTIFQQLRFHPLTESYWDDHALALCILATEVGYRYRGTGTDFWPVLSRELDITTTIAERARLVELFRKIALRYRIRIPGPTPWEEHFPLIAWPIGNAVAPVEIHRPIAEGLRRTVREGLRPTSDSEFLARLIQIAEGSSSIRFSSWLQDSVLAVEVFSRLLGQPVEEPWLSDHVIDRIATDLALDRRANRSISEARAILSRKKGGRRKIEVDPCKLVFDPNGRNGERLFLQGPVLPISTRQEILLTLDVPGDSIHIRGAETVVSISDLLSGGLVPLPYLTELEPPIIGSEKVIEVASQATVGILACLEPSRFRVFKKRKNEEKFYSIPKHSKVDHCSTYLLAPDTMAFGDSESWALLRPDVAEHLKVLRQFLGDEGHIEEETVLFGLPAKEGSMTFMSGFPLFGAIEDFPESFTAEEGHEGVIFSHVITDSDAKLGFVELPEGVWATPKGRSLTVVDTSQDAAASIDLDPVRPSLEDFLNGNIAVTVSAPLPLEKVELELRLEVSSYSPVIVTEVLERLPARLTGFSPLFRNAREQLLEIGTDIGGKTVEFILNAHNLVQKVSNLRPRVISFELGEDQRFRPSETAGSEVGLSYPMIVADSEAPLLVDPKGDTCKDGARLLLPDCDRPGAISSGIIVGSNGSVHLNEFGKATPLPWVREADAYEGRCGLREVARSLIGWRLARTNNVIGELHRRRALARLEVTSVGQLCGEAWAQLEQQIDVTLVDPLQTFLRLAGRRGLTKGEIFPNFPDRCDQELLDDILIRRFSSELREPEQELSFWSKERGEDLDMVVIDAYDELLSRLEEIGRPSFEEVDLSFPHTRWRDTLRDAVSAPKLTMFHRLILPEARWQRLAETDHSPLTPDGMIDLLDSVHVDVGRQPGRRRISREELRALLLFWLAPAKLIELGDWVTPLMCSLSDAFTSRAVRYVVLRQRVAGKDLPDVVGVE